MNNRGDDGNRRNSSTFKKDTTQNHPAHFSSGNGRHPSSRPNGTAMREPSKNPPVRPDGNPRYGQPKCPELSGCSMTNGRQAAPARFLPQPNARRAALLAFSAIIHDDAYASQAINEQLKNANFTQLDKRLCTSIVYRTVENLIAIDFALSGFLTDPETLEPRVRDILRISVCQYLFMDKIPENAIVDEAVKLTRAIGLENMTGLVNGVLRNLIRGKDSIPWPKEDEGARYLSITYSCPQWLVERLTAVYGDDLAKAIVSYRTKEHFMTLRPNLLRMNDEQFSHLLEKKVWIAEKGLIPHAWHIRDASQIALDQDYLAGNFSIQGEASMLCAQIANPPRGGQVLDCCAAPGGKTAYMAEMMGDTGRVYAWDLHDHRVALIKAMTRRLKLDCVRPAVRDARILKEDLVGTLDTVLLDAPCSGLGVIDDKPDIKYRVTGESVADLCKLQKELLETCCQYVKRGGTLVYSTCSILPEENEQQIAEFLKAHHDFVLDKLPPSVDARFADKMGDYGLQLIECRDTIEGFFIARLKRVKG